MFIIKDKNGRYFQNFIVNDYAEHIESTCQEFGKIKTAKGFERFGAAQDALKKMWGDCEIVRLHTEIMDGQ